MRRQQHSPQGQDTVTEESGASTRGRNTTGRRLRTCVQFPTTRRSRRP